MLNAYLAATQNLLQSPTSPTTLYSSANLTTFINTARGQIAGESNAIRAMATISTVVGQRAYNFSALNTGVQATNGIEGAIHVRSVRYALGTGFGWVSRQPWEWFDRYYLSNPVPANGAPANWSQYAQGSAGTGSGSGASGSFYLDPAPDLIYTLQCDCVCYPQALAADGDVEALPYLWTDCVPYFAAYYALLSSQTSARAADADKMLERYMKFNERARMSANPDPERWLYQQSGDPAQAAKLGMTGGAR